MAYGRKDDSCSKSTKKKVCTKKNCPYCKKVYRKIKKYDEKKASVNPFLNFYVSYAAKNKGKGEKQLLTGAAEAWRCMKPQEKMKYVKMSCAKQKLSGAKKSRKRNKYQCGRKECQCEKNNCGNNEEENGKSNEENESNEEEMGCRCDEKNGESSESNEDLNSEGDESNKDEKQPDDKKKGLKDCCQRECTNVLVCVFVSDITFNSGRDS